MDVAVGLAVDVLPASTLGVCHVAPMLTDLGSMLAILTTMVGLVTSEKRQQRLQMYVSPPLLCCAGLTFVLDTRCTNRRVDELAALQGKLNWLHTQLDPRCWYK